MQKRPSQSIVPVQPNMWKDAVLRVKLILRLMGDKRVSPWLKILPFAGIVYIVSPLDDIVLPILGPLDDIALLWLTNHFFIELCPPDVVREHVKALVSNTDIIEEEQQKAAANAPDVIDGEVTDVSDPK